MGFIDAIRTCLQKYVDFKGRARRSEYWYWFLFSTLIGVGAEAISRMMDNQTISVVAGIVMCLPSIAVAIRRLHDIGKSGWFYLLALVPVIGWIILFIWYVRDSEPVENRYGPSPKALYSEI